MELVANASENVREMVGTCSGARDFVRWRKQIMQTSSHTEFELGYMNSIEVTVGLTVFFGGDNHG